MGDRGSIFLSSCNIRKARTKRLVCSRRIRASKHTVQNDTCEHTNRNIHADVDRLNGRAKHYSQHHTDRDPEAKLIFLIQLSNFLNILRRLFSSAITGSSTLSVMGSLPPNQQRIVKDV